MNYIRRCDRALSLTTHRAGEVKVGEAISLPDPTLPLEESWKKLTAHGIRYALVGIPEDIGPRANCGRGGSDGAWGAFLPAFLNQQKNSFLPSEKVTIAGEIVVDDLLSRSHGASLETLRSLCEELDSRVIASLTPLFNSGMIPVVIGGGHNNALPLLRAAHKAHGKLNVLNIDPHFDMRPLEGRHSGNPFSYAVDEGLLESYSVYGFHEGYNSELVLEASAKVGGVRISFEEIAIRSRGTQDHFRNILTYLSSSKAPLTLEIDLDSIARVPSSAMSPLGFSLEEVCSLLHRTTSAFPLAYLHLPEGAPILGGDDGERIVGRVLSSLVSTFIKADSQREK